MSELPTIVSLAPKSSSERYEDNFGRLPVQAVLNMLYAYRPDDTYKSPSGSRQELRADMHTVYQVLLTSSQAGEVNLAAIDDTTLEKVSGYLWELTQTQKFREYRKTGHEALRIVEQQPA